MRWLLSVFLVTGIAHVGGCAKTVVVPIAPENPDAYKKAKSIFVVLKTAEIYEIENFSVRDDSLAGTRILRNETGTKRDEQRVTIALEDISTIQVAKTSRVPAALVGAGVGVVLATAAVTIAYILAFVTALNHL